MQYGLKELLPVLAPWISLAPLATGLFFYRRYQPAFRILVWQTAAASTTEFAAIILRKLWINNLPLLHVYTLIEFVLLYGFCELFWKGLFGKYVVRGVAIAFVLFSLLNSAFIQPVNTFNSYARGLEALLLIGYSLLNFYKLYLTVPAEPADGPAAWVSAGMLVYFSGGFCLFVLSNTILPLGIHLNVQIWAVHGMLSIFLYSCLLIGLWKARAV
ncbi:MAG: hypothetical protein P0Y53_17775 [Candidatus Pseudobacter hemicellulosilyticus]|uniref:Uncharacterized protein n=1 Tax=Candidatus Pseudobacter hemicellulosilyticus TaxID=3121375 RepID=A0AAJ6BES0_9BACT|nr:MAG: hypothetical protein P0Y53_17775 [Pseudobacter sp.]